MHVRYISHHNYINSPWLCQWENRRGVIVDFCNVNNSNNSQLIILVIVINSVMHAVEKKKSLHTRLCNMFLSGTVFQNKHPLCWVIQHMHINLYLSVSMTTKISPRKQNKKWEKTIFISQPYQKLQCLFNSLGRFGPIKLV